MQIHTNAMCGGRGHVRRECPSRPKDDNSAYSSPKLPSHCCAAKMSCDLREFILGNINGLSSESPLSFDSDSSAVFPDSSIACVVTRAQASKASVGNELPISDTLTHFDVLAPFSDLPVRQREDPSLTPWFKHVGLPPVAGVSFRIEDGVLKRLHAKSEFATVQTTIAVPESLRQVVLSYAHESDLAGHSGFRKTLSAIREYFSWPGVCSNVKNTLPPVTCARLNLALVEIGQRRSNRSQLSVNHLRELLSILLVRFHFQVIDMSIC
ncbi:scan domain-containing protein 3 [Plakobranchus ocellatus]|uniref:Scan domain-containing protein 3 n=1 Tax=Plakobranchus ocellatus TaxID=259542 RepID=A0AAV3YCV2_9GAST|nr:scan domain-containing protein 3 [Plakobranchus ocellatus]